MGGWFEPALRARTAWRVAIVLLAGTSFGAGFGAARAQAPDTIGWPAYGGADGGGHFSAATQIDKDNVATLEVAWVHRSGDFRQGRIRGVEGFGGEEPSATAFMATPIV